MMPKKVDFVEVYPAERMHDYADKRHLRQPNFFEQVGRAVVGVVFLCLLVTSAYLAGVHEGGKTSGELLKRLSGAVISRIEKGK